MVLTIFWNFRKVKATISDLLVAKFPDTLSYSKKEWKVITLLTALKRNDIITTDSENKRIAHWALI